MTAPMVTALVSAVLVMVSPGTRTVTVTVHAGSAGQVAPAVVELDGVSEGSRRRWREG